MDAERVRARLVAIGDRHQQFDMVGLADHGGGRWLACRRCREPAPCDALALLQIAEAALALVEDEEWEADGWGPDVTLLLLLRAALARLADSP